MKVAMLGKWPEGMLSGGVAVHTVNLAKNLSKINGLDLYMVSFGSESKVLNEERAKIIMIKTKKIYYILPILALIRLALEVKKIKPDIIHIQGSNLSPYLLYALFLNSKIKTVVTFHSYPVRELIAHEKLKKNSFEYRLLKWLEKKTLKKADVIIAVDTRIKNWITEEFGREFKNKIVVILNGVDVNKYNPELYNNIRKSMRKKYNISEEDFVIFHAKAFTPKNGQEFLVRAIKKILEKKPETRLILAGDGPLREKLIDLTHELGIKEKVIFVGEVPNSIIPEYLAISDVVVVPSIHIEGLEEASSIFLVEAMAMRKPTIATNIGGLKETIEDGINGILVPDKDPNAISNAVLKIINNPVLANKLGENARIYVEKERTWDIVARKTYEIYYNVIVNK